MPFVSRAQQRWGHTPAGMKALGGAAKVAEWDHMTPSLLPRRKSLLPRHRSMLRMPGYAEGGRPPVGMPIMVGEQGPEMFVPDAAGYIAPNAIIQIMEMMARRSREPHTTSAPLPDNGRDTVAGIFGEVPTAAGTIDFPPVVTRPRRAKQTY